MQNLEKKSRPKFSFSISDNKVDYHAKFTQFDHSLYNFIQVSVMWIRDYFNQWKTFQSTYSCLQKNWQSISIFPVTTACHFLSLVLLNVYPFTVDSNEIQCTTDNRRLILSASLILFVIITALLVFKKRKTTLVNCFGLYLKRDYCEVLDTTAFVRQSCSGNFGELDWVPWEWVGQFVQSRRDCWQDEGQINSWVWNLSGA